MANEQEKQIPLSPPFAKGEAKRTIGVFDSGVGGLSVLHHIRATLPDANLIYVADSGHVPYGDKSPAYIEARSLALTRFLVSQGAEAIVIACNTATAAAAHTLRVKFSKLPIVAMEPAVKPAVAATQSGVVGVLATVGTLESARFAALLEKYGGKVKIVTQGCPGLVDVVERGDLHSNEARRLIERYTDPLLKQNADTLILGCTHYPFLTPLIREVVGNDIALVDTGAAVARELKRRVDVELPVRLTVGVTGAETFFTSGDAEQAARIMSLLWSSSVTVSQLPDEFM